MVLGGLLGKQVKVGLVTVLKRHTFVHRVPGKCRVAKLLKESIA